MTRLSRLALRANGKAVVQMPAALVRVRAPYLKEPAYGGFFAFCSPETSSPFRKQKKPENVSAFSGFFLLMKQQRRALSVQFQPLTLLFMMNAKARIICMQTINGRFSVENVNKRCVCVH